MDKPTTQKRIASALGYVLAMIIAVVSVQRAVHAKPHVDHGRYYSPDNEFSVPMLEGYHPKKEYSDAHVKLVDFPFSSGIVTGWTSVRSIEWLKLNRVVPNAEYEDTARAIIEDNKVKRFKGFQFEVKQGRLVGDARLSAYEFVAAGRCRGMDCGWHGIVLFYGDRVALVSEFISPADLNGFDLVAPMAWNFVGWARSLTREDRRQKP